MGCFGSSSSFSHQNTMPLKNNNQNCRSSSYISTNEAQNQHPESVNHLSSHRNKEIMQKIIKEDPLQQNNHEEQSDTMQKPVLQALLRANDRRNKINQKLKFPFNCIGLLYFANAYQEKSKKRLKQYMATGFLIAPNIAVTAAHFIQIFKKIGNDEMKFLISAHENEDFLQVCIRARKAVQFSIMNSYNSFEKKINEDFGLIYLDSDIPRERYIKLASNFNQIDAEAHIYGFSHETFKQSFNLIGMKGPIKQIKDNMVLYDIDTSMGQSGSPIMIEYITGEYITIGIHSGKDNEDKYNSGCLIGKELINYIYSWINQFKNIDNETRSTNKSFYLKKNQPNLSIHQISVIDLEKSSINILSEIKALKIQSQLIQTEQSSGNQLRLSQQSYWQKKYHQSMIYAEQALCSRSANQPQKILLYNLMGLNYAQLRQFQLALYYYSEGLKRQIAFNKSNKITLIKILNNIGVAYLKLNKTGLAKKYFNKAKKVSRRIIIQSDQQQLSILLSEGQTYINESNYLKAYNLFKSAKLFSFKTSQSINHQKAQIMHNLAHSSFKLSKYDEWLQYSFACLWILKKFGDKGQTIFSKQYRQFLKQINSMRSCQRSLLLKLGRIWTILQLKLDDLDSSTFQKIQNILKGSQHLKIIQ